MGSLCIIVLSCFGWLGLCKIVWWFFLFFVSVVCMFVVCWMIFV